MARKRVQLWDIGKFKNQLQTALKTALDEQFLPDTVLPEVEALVRELFNRTISQWEGGTGALQIEGHSKKTRIEPDAPALQLDIKRKKFGAEITAHVDSYIWNLLDQGRGTRVTEKVEKFVPRVNQRTVPGTLDVSGQREYDSVRYLPKDYTVKGFKARGWTQLIVDEVEKQLGHKYPNIKFSFTVKEQSLA